MIADGEIKHKASQEETQEAASPLGRMRKAWKVPEQESCVKSLHRKAGDRQPGSAGGGKIEGSLFVVGFHVANLSCKLGTREVIVES